MYIRGFTKFGTYPGIVKATVFGVFEDLKFKISEGLDQNWDGGNYFIFILFYSEKQ